jgi:drug/metabolite transporter (DMT)-like permease
MDSTEKIKDKIKNLSDAINDNIRKVSIKDQCFPTAIAIGSVVPFVTMVSLFLFKPRFVQKKEGSKSLRDPRKIFWWTLLLTIGIWICMTGFNYYKGFDSLAMMCVV